MKNCSARYRNICPARTTHTIPVAAYVCRNQGFFITASWNRWNFRINLSSVPCFHCHFKFVLEQPSIQSVFSRLILKSQSSVYTFWGLVSVLVTCFTSRLEETVLAWLTLLNSRYFCDCRIVTSTQYKIYKCFRTLDESSPASSKNCMTTGFPLKTRSYQIASCLSNVIARK